MVEPPERRAREDHEVRASGSESLEVVDCTAAVSRVVPRKSSVRRLRKVPRSPIAEPKQLLVAFADDDDCRVMGQRCGDDLADAPDELGGGGGAILSPLGQYLAGPLYGREGILYADLDRDALAAAKFDFDVVGHYARNDIFKFDVNERPQAPDAACDERQHQ